MEYVRKGCGMVDDNKCVDILTFALPESRFLSNFYPYKNKNGDKYPYSVRVFYARIEFDCVENAYQAAKLTSRDDMVRFSRMTPFETKWAMDAGQYLVRAGVGMELNYALWWVVQKFTTCPELAQMLRATGNAKLVEGNHWGDVFWGVCNGIGENHLGRS